MPDGVRQRSCPRLPRSREGVKQPFGTKRIYLQILDDIDNRERQVMASINPTDVLVPNDEKIGIFWFEDELIRAVQVGPDLRNVGTIIDWLPLWEFTVIVTEDQIELRDSGSGISETLKPSVWLVRHGPEGWGTVDDPTFRLVYRRYSGTDD